MCLSCFTSGSVSVYQTLPTTLIGTMIITIIIYVVIKRGVTSNMRGCCIFGPLTRECAVRPEPGLPQPSWLHHCAASSVALWPSQRKCAESCLDLDTWTWTWTWTPGQSHCWVQDHDQPGRACLGSEWIEWEGLWTDCYFVINKWPELVEPTRLSWLDVVFGMN